MWDGFQMLSSQRHASRLPRPGVIYPFSVCPGLVFPPSDCTYFVHGKLHLEHVVRRHVVVVVAVAAAGCARIVAAKAAKEAGQALVISAGRLWQWANGRSRVIRPWDGPSHFTRGDGERKNKEHQAGAMRCAPPSD